MLVLWPMCHFLRLHRRHLELQRLHDSELSRPRRTRSRGRYLNLDCSCRCHFPCFSSNRFFSPTLSFANSSSYQVYWKIELSKCTPFPFPAIFVCFFSSLVPLLFETVLSRNCNLKTLKQAIDFQFRIHIFDEVFNDD